jgi:hypothetical protein
VTEAPVSRRPRRRRPVSRGSRPESNGHRGRPPAPSGPAGDVGSVLQLVTAIGSPIALGTALLFYFGWRRSAEEAKALGFDVSVLGMSPQDFMLRSVPVLFFPVALLLLASLGAVWAHARLLRHLDRDRGRDRVLWVADVLRWSWLLLLLAGVALLIVAPSLGRLFLPTFVTLGVLGTIYSSILRRRATQDPTRTRLAVTLLVAALVALLLFWQTERLALVAGQALAEQIGANVHARTAVTIYSPKKLQLGPDVSETRFTEPDSAYRYRYDGLRLLDHASGKYFLLPDRWTRERPRLVVIRDDATVRIEFTRGR